MNQTNILNIQCIAEFVEREETVTILNELGTEIGQGYHLARPDAKFVREIVEKTANS